MAIKVYFFRVRGKPFVPIV